jgi:hypothetical protein
MKSKEMKEGREALDNFTNAMKSLFRAPKAALAKPSKRKARKAAHKP